MMWDRVLPAWVAMLRADVQLVSALGGEHIYPASAGRAVRIPSVEWLIVSDREEEVFNPILVQVDFWARGQGVAAAIERRIRLLTHRDVSRELGGLRMWTLYRESRMHDYRAEGGVVHRSLDFMFRPVREKYFRPDTPES